MADYKELLGSAFSKVKDKVKDSGVADVYAQGAGRARAFGQIAKLSLALNSDHEELNRVYAEIGRLYYEQAKDAPEGYFTALFSLAGRLAADIRAKRDQMQELKDRYGAEGKMDDDMSAFDDIVSAAERDATQAPKD